MLSRGADYAATRAAFRWQVPERFNIAVAACDRHADGSGRAAIVEDGPEGVVVTSFDRLRRLTNRLANLYAALGLGRGERIGILLPQRLETAMAHLAAYKLGAIALPLFIQFGPDALEHRLGHSGARALVTDRNNLAKVEEIRSRLPDLRTILLVDEAGPDGFWPQLERASDRFEPVDTAADDPALVIYTSGTTGRPKGALHAHRVLIGHLPGVQVPQEFFPQPGDRFWTPADWAWAGGLLDVLLPSLYFGVPVVAHRDRKFDPEAAFALLARHRVRNAFLPPTALKMMRQVDNPRGRFGYAMRSIGTGGEALGEDILAWCRDTFGFSANEFYGQTEANLLVSNCESLFPIRPGSMGRAVPGHEVAVIDPDGQVLPPDERGMVALRAPDPVAFLGYWRAPDETAAKFVGDWIVTGDLARRDPDGYFWYGGREDDLISSGSYRIGPSDIEDCIMKHPAVLMVAVIGAPDPTRGEIVKAFVVTRSGQGDEALAAEIQDFVRGKLAGYQHPRAVEFMAELPLTPTGKIRRRDLRDREIARQRSLAGEEAS